MAVLSSPRAPVLMTEFTKRVMALVRAIPKGRVATYGQIAALAGKPHGARGVGWILSSSSHAHRLPWQRVINSKGKISFGKRTELYREQRKFLAKDGVKFRPDDAVDLELYAWKKKPRASKAARGRPTMFG